MQLTEFLLARLQEDIGVLAWIRAVGGDPGHMTREVKRKQKVVDQHMMSRRPRGPEHDWLVCEECSNGGGDAESSCVALRALALAYAYHPDYDDAGWSMERVTFERDERAPI